MLKEWLKPSLEKRTNDLIDAYIANTNETHTKFMAILTDLNSRFCIGSETIEIENLFHLNSVISIEYSYMIGFEDGLSLYNK
jgi:hypothetical protein